MAQLPPRLIADKAWDSQKWQSKLWHEREIELIAPLRGGDKPSTRHQDGRALRRYKRRWKVERLLAWLKQMRRIALRWEHHADNYLGWLQLGCIVVILRRKLSRI